MVLECTHLYFNYCIGIILELLFLIGLASWAVYGIIATSKACCKLIISISELFSFKILQLLWIFLCVPAIIPEPLFWMFSLKIWLNFSFDVKYLEHFVAILGQPAITAWGWFENILYSTVTKSSRVVDAVILSRFGLGVIFVSIFMKYLRSIKWLVMIVMEFAIYLNVTNYFWFYLDWN